MVKDLIKSEKVASKLYPSISPRNKENWKAKHIPLDYIETYFQFDYQELYYSFQQKLNWKLKRSKREKAFHKVWSELYKVKYFETQKEKDIESLVTRNREAVINYNKSLVDLKNFHQEVFKKIKNDPTFLQAMHLQTVKKYYLNSWKDYLAMNEKDQQHHLSSYNFLVRPLLQIAKEYPDHPLMEPLIPIIVNCETKYQSIVNVLNFYQEAFKNQYFVYRTSRRLISKANEVI